MPKPPADLTKHIFTFKTYLTPLRMTGERRNGSLVWLCRCECGTLHEVTSHGITRGTTRSCGQCHLLPRNRFEVKQRDKLEGKVEKPKPLNVRAAKKEIVVDQEIRKYEEKPRTGIYRKRREMTANDIGIIEAKMCGAGRWNWI